MAERKVTPRDYVSLVAAFERIEAHRKIRFRHQLSACRLRFFNYVKDLFIQYGKSPDPLKIDGKEEKVDVMTFFRVYDTDEDVPHRYPSAGEHFWFQISNGHI